MKSLRDSMDRSQVGCTRLTPTTDPDIDLALLAFIQRRGGRVTWREVGGAGPDVGWE